MQLPSFSPSTLRALCLLAVALWLGWSLSVLAHLHTGAGVDNAEVMAALDRIPAQARTSGRPLAVRLATRCQCPPTQADAGIKAVMAASGGDWLWLADTPATANTVALLVLNAQGELVYSGPVDPPTALCGRQIPDSADWLPGLLTGQLPPLHLGTTPCIC